MRSPDLAAELRRIADEVDCILDATDADLLRRAASALEAERWVSVEERRPDPDAIVIAWVGVDEHPYATIGRNIGRRVTHWRPLPPAPDAKGGE